MEKWEAGRKGGERRNQTGGKESGEMNTIPHFLPAHEHECSLSVGCILQCLHLHHLLLRLHLLLLGETEYHLVKVISYKTYLLLENIGITIFTILLTPGNCCAYEIKFPSQK